MSNYLSEVLIASTNCTYSAFIAGGIAACGAVTVTHGFETVKIRYATTFMQHFDELIGEQSTAARRVTGQEGRSATIPRRLPWSQRYLQE